MSISMAIKADIPALNILINNAYRGEGAKKGWTTEADLLDGVRTSEQSLAELINKEGATILVSKDENNIITGCVYLQKEPGTCYLGMLTVSPLLQAAGIGRQLLHAAEKYARRENINNISMTVISVRQELIDWYERNDYTKTGETKPFPTDPAFGIPKQPLEFVVMRKNI
ncbi:MAG: GNAT family N-acetyltransferase [Bacteroidota bacterium]